MIKYVDKMICFQEIPDEISLGLSISNCPNNCEDCHSPYLREDKGIPVLSVLDQLLLENKNMVTCILFLGGDDEKQIDDLIECLKICKKQGYKTALYSGFDDIKDDLLPFLDYYKIGSYKRWLGGLKEQTTNQKLFKVVDGQLKEDITYLFWRKP